VSQASEELDFTKACFLIPVREREGRTVPRGKKDDITLKRHAVTQTGGNIGFADLVIAIRQVHEHCAGQAKLAVNMNLTLRNWVIGGYIHHYELNGKDRAKYGEAMIDRLASELAEHEVTACDRPRLYSYLAFFRTYPQVGDAIPSGALPPLGNQLYAGKTGIVRSTTGESDSDPRESIVPLGDRTIGRDRPNTAAAPLLHASRVAGGHRRSP
jgi:hypothetical protein